MSEPSWARIQELFHAALGLHPERRRAFLEQACGDDAELLQELLQLLDAHDADDGSFEGPLRIDAPHLADFEIIDELGAGSMGVVYRAWQYSLQREVAIKTLPARLAQSERLVERFQREARSMAKLDHPGIVRVHAVSREGSTHFFVMEYVPGRNLAAELDLLRDPKSSEERSTLPPFGSEDYVATVIELCADISDALEHAHAMGIVHRDIKPHNVVLGRDGSPRVTDFGLARDASSETLSRTGELAGTPYYMSPEQARAESSARGVDHRTDVYSMGVVLYELLTLQRPFEGRTSVEVIHKIATARPRPLCEVCPSTPVDLQTICEKAMRKDTALRYPSAAELGADLRRFLAHSAIHASPMSWLERAHDFRARRPVAAAVGITLVASVLLTLGAGVLWRSHRETQRAEEAIAALPPVGEVNELRSQGFEGLPTLESLVTEMDAIEARWDTDPDALAERRSAAQAVALEIATTAVAEIGLLLGPDGVAVGDRARTEECLRVAIAAAGLVRDRTPGLEPVLSAIHPSLDLFSEPAGAAVVAIPLDRFSGLPLPGPPIQLGATPVTGFALPSGFYRLVVTTPDGRRAEHSMRLNRYRGRHTAPVLYPRSDAQATAGMLRIETGPYEADPPAPTDGPTSDQQVPYLRGEQVLPGFFIDPHEVTNGEYRAFCAATGHPTPTVWPQVWDPAWDDLPVTFVNVFDAEAYAAWAGKRLPTYPEWARAARGAQLARYPWGDEPSDLATLRARANVAGDRVEDADAEDPAARWNAYVSHVSPVGTHPQDVSPDGVLDPLGNLAEWTASPSFRRVVDEGWDIDPGQRFVLGCGWSMSLRPLNHRQPVANQSTDSGIGFRCVRSIVP